MNINSVTFAGNAGADAELKQVGESQVATFSLAVASGFGDNKITSWVRVNVWGKPATSVAQYVKKGNNVGVTGELVIRKYNDKQGVERQSVEVNNARVSFGPKRDNVETNEDGNVAKTNGYQGFDDEDEFSN